VINLSFRLIRCELMMNEEEQEDLPQIEERPSSSNLELEYDTDGSSESDSSDKEVVSPLAVGSAKPVKGEAFCDCYKTGREKECICGEDDACTKFFS
jgi:hypothetical protein